MMRTKLMLSIVLALFSLFLVSCANTFKHTPSVGHRTKEKIEHGEQKMEEPKIFTTESGLQYQILKEGFGDSVVAGMVEVHYTGWLYEAGEKGIQFDSSRDRGMPFKFELGRGKVIRGWEEGIKGMKAGEIRRLIIPPELGYGHRGAGNLIPPDATLLFEVELLRIL